MSDTLPTAPDEGDVELARKALALGWVSLIDLETAITKGGDVLSTLRLTEEQLAELRRVKVPTRALPAEVEEAAKDPSRRAGRYLLLNLLGQGGMGSVYRAWDTGLRRFVALKFLKQVGDETARAFFRREALVSASLDHPNIAKVYEVGEHDGAPFIAMQFIDGETLGARAKSMKLGEKLAVLRTVAGAIRFAHDRKVIHRDLKPTNVMLDRDGRPYVMDFGLAKETAVEGRSLTGDSILGTPNYMAPEQVRGRADAQSDVYSLGAILYELATGRPPFVGETPGDILMQVMSADPPWPRKLARGLPEDVEAVILKAIEKEKARRYATAAELVEDLDALEKGKPLRHARRPTFAYVLAKRIRRQPALWAVAAALVLALGAGAVVGADQYRRVREEQRLRREDNARAAKRQQALQRLSTLAATMTERKRAMRMAPPRATSRAGLEQAVEAVSRFIEEWPDLPQGYFVRARGRHFLGDRPGADGDLAKALSLARDFRPGWTLLGMLRLEEFFERKTLSRGRKTKDDLIEVGTAYLALGWEPGREHEEGARWGLAWTAEDGVAVVLAEAMRLYYREGRHARAMEVLDEGWEQYRAEELLILRAGIEPEKARQKELCARLLDRSPGHAPAYQFRGWIALSERREQEAHADFDRALLLHPDSPLALLGRAMTGRDAKPEQAMADCDRALALAPDLDVGYFTRGILRERRKDFAGALADFNHAIRLNPSGLYHHQRGALRLDLGDESGAMDDMTAATQVDPTFAAAWFSKAALHVRRGEPRKAVHGYTMALVQGYDDIAQALSLRGVTRKEVGDFAGAADDLGRALAFRPRWADVIEEWGRAHWSNPSLAAPAHARALDLGISDPASGFYNLAAARYRLGDHAGAARGFGRALAFRLAWKDLLYWRANARFGTGDRLGALENITLALALGAPNPGQGHYIRGFCRFELRDFRGALADFAKCDPGSFDAAYLCGKTRMLLGDLRGALADWHRALSLRPAHAEARYWIGRCLYDAGHFAPAAAEFESAIRLGYAATDLHYRHALALYSSGRYREAHGAFGRAIEAQPGAWLPRYMRAQSLRMLSLPKEALDDFLVFRALVVPTEEGWYWIGKTHHETGRPLLALETLTAALSSPQPDLFLLRGLSGLQLGESRLALRDLERAVRRQPDSFEPFLARGQAHLRQRDGAAALRDFDRALELEPGHLAALYYRGHARNFLGDHAGALADFDRVLDGGDFPDVRADRAFTRRCLGQAEAAVDELTETLRIHPDSQPCRQTRALLRFELRRWRESLEDFRKSTGPYAALFIWALRVRLGERADANEELRRAAPAGWAGSLARHLLGERPEAELLREAGEADPVLRSERACEARFYAGLKLLLDGDREGAKSRFREAVRQEQRLACEHWCAKAELEALKP